MLVNNKEIKRQEKDRIRFRTIRYLERYCNIEKKCQICGEKAEIHHTDYKNYLKVNLLCKKHHVLLHKGELITPPIIDLEKIAIKKQIKTNKKQLVQENINKIKNDILENGKTFYDITKEYKTTPGTIKQFLNYSEIEQLTKKSKENTSQKRKNKKFTKNI